MKIEVEDLKKISILPGETLVIRYDINSNRNLIMNTIKGFREVFPNNKVIAVPSNIEIYKLISEEKDG